MKKIALLIITLLPLALVGALYSRLPDLVPVHWDVTGNVSYGPKYTLLFIAGLSPVMMLLFIFIPKIDPRKQNYGKFRGSYEAFMAGMALFLLIITGVVVSESLSPGRISVGTVVPMQVGGLLLFIGNMMPKMKNNFFIGVRTPWTLSDSEVWNKTHRLAGFMWTGGGALIILASFFLKENSLFIFLMVLIGVMSLVPVVYSYLLFNRLKKERE